MALNDVPDPTRQAVTLGTLLVGLLAGIAVTLSAACLYALMSFTVSERTREIGIRTALGAQPANIVFAIARRAFLQIFVGVLIGSVLGAVMLPASNSLNTGLVRVSNWPLALGLIALSVIVVGMLACVSPTRRGIRIRPMEVLKG